MDTPVRTAKLMLPLKAVRIAFLDENLKPAPAFNSSGAAVGQAVASGFMFRTAAGLFVATCWHAVSGVQSFDRPKVPPLGPRRAYADILCQGYEPQSSPGMDTLGGVRTFRLEILDLKSPVPSVPLWWQRDRLGDNEEMSQANLARPKYADLVLIKVPDQHRFASEQILSEQELWNDMVLPTDAVSIAGYPYGFNPNPISPTPVLITRNVAAAIGQTGGSAHEFMLDGMAAPGMSGGPVFIERTGKLYLCGIYTGCRFPDKGMQPERVTALGTAHSTTLLKAHNVAKFLPYAQAEVIA